MATQQGLNIGACSAAWSRSPSSLRPPPRARLTHQTPRVAWQLRASRGWLPRRVWFHPPRPLCLASHRRRGAARGHIAVLSSSSYAHPRPDKPPPLRSPSCDSTSHTHTRHHLAARAVLQAFNVVVGGIHHHAENLMASVFGPSGQQLAPFVTIVVTSTLITVPIVAVFMWMVSGYFRRRAARRRELDAAKAKAAAASASASAKDAGKGSEAAVAGGAAAAAGAAAGGGDANGAAPPAPASEGMLRAVLCSPCRCCKRTFTRAVTVKVRVAGGSSSGGGGADDDAGIFARVTLRERTYAELCAFAARKFPKEVPNAAKVSHFQADDVRVSDDDDVYGLSNGDKLLVHLVKAE